MRELNFSEVEQVSGGLDRLSKFIFGAATGLSPIALLTQSDDVGLGSDIVLPQPWPQDPYDFGIGDYGTPYNPPNYGYTPPSNEGYGPGW